MQIRPVAVSDLAGLVEIDGTIESSKYLHVDRVGEGLAVQWRLEERPLREKLMERNLPGDEKNFMLKQIVTGVEDGIALLAEHEEQIVALLVAHVQQAYGTLNLIDLRVDFDARRQGLATALLYQAISEARNRELRAVAAECHTGNIPACRLFERVGFNLAGLDLQRRSNHDLVKEAATLFWYASLD